MNDFAKHLTEIANLLQAGVDPLPLYEFKEQPAGVIWSDAEHLEDLLDPSNTYRLKPRQVTVGDQTFDLPVLVEGGEYWAANFLSPNNPVKLTYTAGNSNLKYQGECGYIVATKKTAIDMAKSMGYVMSQGGAKL